MRAGVLDRALADVFGFGQLRPGQAEIIAEILEGQPVVAVMPTGAGKSLCYQLPAVVLGERGGITLVVSPLIALMKDQVDALTARGVSALALTSALSPEQQRDAVEGLRAGLFTMVYIAPERLRSPRFVDALRSIGDRLALVAIDEAHCISEWGHDFRPDYRRLGDLVRTLRPPRLAAFTATATPEVRADIAAQLAMTSPRIHVRGFDRPNLTYAVERVRGLEEKSERLIELARKRDGGVALVYAATRKNAEKYGEVLKRAGMRARVYHAGLDDRSRDDAQDVFMAGKLDVIVATNAFGMGIDKGDIRVVVHADIPRSPEAYYQECGRGGRDGRATRCTLLFGAGDVRLQEFLIDASYPSTEVLRGLWKLLKERPELGGEDNADERLAKLLPGTPHASAVGTGLRMLERHGLAVLDGGSWVATRPEPGTYPPLDVEGLARRAEVERGKLKAMVDFAWSARCRRQVILAYFGDEEWSDPGRRCGACDACDAAAHGGAALDHETQASIRALLHLVGDLHGRFGRTRVAAIANGSDDDDRFVDLAGRACLRGWSQKDVLDLLRVLEGAGLVDASRGEYPTIATTRRGDAAAVGKLDLDTLGLRIIAPGGGRKKRPAGAANGGKKPNYAAMAAMKKARGKF
ncbi:MAG TPA: ATP-dependent DNA helicase RecQ [Kofleriaceae bacterium]|nr:ATP-dependent DNA helicase RecQ [Kofleriaceae bacterium]